MPDISVFQALRDTCCVNPAWPTSARIPFPGGVEMCVHPTCNIKQSRILITAKAF